MIGIRPSTAAAIARQRLDRRGRAVDLAAAVVGDDDPVDALVDRAAGVVGVQDALEQDRQLRALAQERQVLPRQRRPRVDAREGLHGGARVARAQARHEAVRVGARELHERAQGGRRRLGLLVLAEHDGLLGDDPPEDRVARVLRDPLAAQERQVGDVQVARAPAEHRRVERDHDRLAAAALGALDEAGDEVVVGGPVELEPARRVAELARARLHRARGLVGEDHRHALGARRARDRQVGVVVDHLQHADRAQQERRVQLAAEQLDARVALGDVAQHPRHDPPAVEALAVGAHGGARCRRRRRCRRTPRRASPSSRAPRAGWRRWGRAAGGR